MSSQTPTHILIIWKHKSRIVPDIRRILDEEALNSPNHKIDQRNLAFDPSRPLIPRAREYVDEFGLSTFDNVREMCRIWYQHPERMGWEGSFPL